MSVVASEVSPLNCRWITWHDTLPVCTRPPGPAHVVSEAECALCAHWEEPAQAHVQHEPHKPAPPHGQDPLNRESCPRCGSHDVVLMSRDALVQSFACSICHQRWLATRPWPLLREVRSRPRT
ncbi:MAG: hypothetical protein U0P82_05680 [Vicinamibacterales bacterium]